MFINFDFNDICHVEIKVGNQITQQGSIPFAFAKQQMAQLVQDCANDNRPVRVKCYFYDYTKNGNKIENSLTFRNNSYLNNFKED